MRFDVGDRHLELTYQTITDASGGLRVLVVMTDASARIEREHAERDEREVSALIARMLRGGAGFVAFQAEAAAYVAAIAESPNGTELRRTIHTLKGIAALEGIGSIASLCHELETALADQDDTRATALRADIAQHWATLSGKLEPLMRALEDRIDVREVDLEALEAAARQGGDVAALVRSLRDERVATPLERLAEDARSLAKRLGKGTLDVRVEVDETLRLPAERWSSFWSTAIHVVRNAVDHGLEPPDERLATGKRLTPCLTLRARRRSGAVEIEIADDGRGIDWTSLAASAGKRGLPNATERDLVEALFADGISTRTEVTETSGRGIGMAALRHSVVISGGSIDVATSPAGTTFAFVWPEDAVAIRAVG
jgi:two-component system chemotaxis sensor kinase CheA